MVIDIVFFFFFQAEDGIRDIGVTGVQTCALPICPWGTCHRRSTSGRRPVERRWPLSVAGTWDRRGPQSVRPAAGPVSGFPRILSATAPFTEAEGAEAERMRSGLLRPA